MSSTFSGRGSASPQSAGRGRCFASCPHVCRLGAAADHRSRIATITLKGNPGVVACAPRQTGPPRTHDLPANNLVNSMNKSRSTILVGIALASVALMLLPQAAAQTVPPSQITVNSVGAPTAPIKPAIENPTFTTKFTYTLPTQAQSANAGVQPNVQVTLTPQCASGVVIAGAPVTIV